MMQRKSIQLAILCIIASALLLFFHVNYLFHVIPLAILVAGFLYEPFAVLFLLVWEKFGSFLGYINSKLILTVMYFLIVTPYSVLYRWKGKSNYQNKLDKKEISLFKPRSYTFQKTDFEKTW